MSDQPKSPDDCQDDRSAGEASIILVSGAPGSWKTTLARQLLLQSQRKDSVFAHVTRYILGDHEAALAEIDRLANQ
jgi:uridine kinase